MLYTETIRKQVFLFFRTSLAWFLRPGSGGAPLCIPSLAARQGSSSEASSCSVSWCHSVSPMFLTNVHLCLSCLGSICSKDQLSVSAADIWLHSQVRCSAPAPPPPSHSSRQHCHQGREERRGQGHTGSFHNLVRSSVYICRLSESCTLNGSHIRSINDAFLLILTGASKQFIDVKSKMNWNYLSIAEDHDGILTCCKNHIWCHGNLLSVIMRKSGWLGIKQVLPELSHDNIHASS